MKWIHEKRTCGKFDSINIKKQLSLIMLPFEVCRLPKMLGAPTLRNHPVLQNLTYKLYYHACLLPYWVCDTASGGPAGATGFLFPKSGSWSGAHSNWGLEIGCFKEPTIPTIIRDNSRSFVALKGNCRQ